LGVPDALSWSGRRQRNLPPVARPDAEAADSPPSTAQFLDSCRPVQRFRITQINHARDPTPAERSVLPSSAAALVTVTIRGPVRRYFRLLENLKA